jgi:predicted lipoprotein
MRIRVTIFYILTLVFSSCTIVKNDTSQTATANDYAFSIGTIDPKQYANEIWDTVVIPRIENIAVPFDTLMTGLNKDPEGTSEEYGFRLSNMNPYNFAVKGTVKFLSIDTGSANGMAALDFAGGGDADNFEFDGSPDCLLRIGPVLRGLALRDIQDTISLNSFANQVDWARLATELNNKVKETVLLDIDFTGKAGSEAELVGVFTYEGNGSGDPGEIVITPVRLVFKDTP